MSKPTKTVEKPAGTDDQALELRRKGRTFGAIARELGLDGIRGASQAFNRALRAQPARLQAEIRREEGARLDSMWRRASRDADLGPDDLERRRRVIAWHRARLAED